MKKALILDLDNTIYPVSSIADHLFAELFATLDSYAELINSGDADRVSTIKDEMTRRPFQYIAEKYSLNELVRDQMEDVLRTMSYELPMTPFDDYQYIRSAPIDKFLVTTGYSKLQWSKVKMLGIEKDFRQIHIVDPDISQKTKKDVFAEIMQSHHFGPDDLLVIGDDPDSEIKAANSLGIESFLYDPQGKYPNALASRRSEVLREALAAL